MHPLQHNNEAPLCLLLYTLLFFVSRTSNTLDHALGHAKSDGGDNEELQPLARAPGRGCPRVPRRCLQLGRRRRPMLFRWSSWQGTGKRKRRDASTVARVCFSVRHSVGHRWLSFACACRQFFLLNTFSVPCCDRKLRGSAKTGGYLSSGVRSRFLPRPLLPNSFFLLPSKRDPVYLCSWL